MILKVNIVGFGNSEVAIAAIGIEAVVFVAFAFEFALAFP